MKKILAFSLVIAVLLLLLPLTVLGQPQKSEEQSVNVTDVSPVKTFKILRSDTGSIDEISYTDYIFGVVAAEMPALYESEALKAQAVAAHTFALYRTAANSDKEYDITDDFTLDQAFISEAAAREKWGDNADEYIEKIRSAVNDTQNLVLTYNGELALAVYHAVSFGKTEDCSNVWGTSLPYLTSVSSIGDKLSPNFISTKTVTLNEVKTLFSDLTLSDNQADYFKNIQKTEAGTVKSLEICKNTLSGSEIRNKLDLRSACFDVAYNDGAFTFTVYGYGHGVGMSQNGANYMAQQGADYKEILCHYYTGCKVEKIK